MNAPRWVARRSGPSSTSVVRPRATDRYASSHGYPPPLPTRIYINMGRMGDAMNSVAMCYRYWVDTGRKCSLLVARQFSGFLEGISYINPEIWDGDFKDVSSAKIHCAKLGYRDVRVAQIYGFGINAGGSQTSFVLESWNKVGLLKEWGRTPLVFDRRNLEREAELAAALPTGLPIVLVATSGHSAKFPYPHELLYLLRKHFKDQAHIVDLDDYQTKHYHDFLGLFDRACCLVTGDTAFGVLATASKIPICALIAYQPTFWHTSPLRPQHICYIRYHEFLRRTKVLLAAVESCVHPLPSSYVITSPKPVIHHLWSGISKSLAADHRTAMARLTWDREAANYGAWQEHFFGSNTLKRSAVDVGDIVALPYINDMFNTAMALAEKDEDILMITNEDISLVPGLAQEVVDTCLQFGSTYCHRWDFPHIHEPVNRSALTYARWYIGCDLFACTVRWWREHGPKLPPYVLGRETWDWAFRVLINETGGKAIEQGIYHEKHESHWETDMDLAGNVYNRSYTKIFLTQRGIPLAELTDRKFVDVEWPKSDSP